MIKKSSLVLGLSVLLFPFQSDAVTAEQTLQQEFERNNAKIDEIFRDKVEKISAREALPEEMRKLLLMQADEIRQFDLDMLQKKMDLKEEHAKQRDELKEKLRKDAQNRAKWMLEDEERFERLKEDRQSVERAVLDEVEAIQKGLMDNPSKEEIPSVTPKKGEPEKANVSEAASSAPVEQPIQQKTTQPTQQKTTQPIQQKTTQPTQQEPTQPTQQEPTVPDSKN